MKDLILKELKSRKDKLLKEINELAKSKKSVIAENASDLKNLNEKAEQEKTELHQQNSSIKEEISLLEQKKLELISSLPNSTQFAIVKMDGTHETQILPFSDLTKEDSEIDEDIAPSLQEYHKIIKDFTKTILSKAKIYLKPNEKPPEGAQVKHGPRGGMYYEERQVVPKHPLAGRSLAVKPLVELPLGLSDIPEVTSFYAKYSSEKTAFEQLMACYEAWEWFKKNKGDLSEEQRALFNEMHQKLNAPVRKILINEINADKLEEKKEPKESKLIVHYPKVKEYMPKYASYGDFNIDVRIRKQPKIERYSGYIKVYSKEDFPLTFMSSTTIGYLPTQTKEIVNDEIMKFLEKKNILSGINPEQADRSESINAKIHDEEKKKSQTEPRETSDSV